MVASDPSVIVHASAVTAHDQGLLIRGASGSGKSALSLALMGLGARLVADDRVILHREGPHVTMSAPQTLAGMIEARGLGLLGADPAGPARLDIVLDLDHDEDQRLPPRRSATLLGVEHPLLHKPASPYFPAALMQYLKGGRRE